MILFKVQDTTIQLDGRTIDDMVQDVIIKIYKFLKKNGYDLSKNKPIAFVQTVSFNHLIDTKRRSKEKITLFEGTYEIDNVHDDKGISFWDHVSSHRVEYEEIYEFLSEEELKILRTQINKALSMMREEERIIVTLYFFENWSYEEIANYLKIPLGTLKGTFFRIKKDLEVLLKPFYHTVRNYQPQLQH